MILKKNSKFWNFFSKNSSFLAANTASKTLKDSRNIQALIQTLLLSFVRNCSDFRSESNGIIVLGVVFFSSDNFRLFT